MNATTAAAAAGWMIPTEWINVGGQVAAAIVVVLLFALFFGGLSKVAAQLLTIAIGYCVVCGVVANLYVLYKYGLFEQLRDRVTTITSGVLAAKG